MCAFCHIFVEIYFSIACVRQPIEPCLQKDYRAFRSNFSIASHASEIVAILDHEPKVSQFLEDLVPAVVDKEEFWSR